MVSNLYLLTILFHHAFFSFSWLLTYAFSVQKWQTFNPTAEHVIPIWILSEEVKADIETHTVTPQTKISDCLM